MMFKPSLILFDLDGTLVDSYDSIYDSTVSILSKYSEKIPSREEVARSVGLPIVQLFGKYLIQSCLDVAVEEFREDLRLHGHKKTKLIPDAKATLEILKSEKILLSLVTNKQTALAKSVLKQQGISQYFDQVVGADLGRPKPFPDLIERALSKFPNSMKSAMVGDRLEDMQAARAAGVNGIFLLNPYHGIESLNSLLPYKPKVISSLRQLPQTYREIKVK